MKSRNKFFYIMAISFIALWWSLAFTLPKKSSQLLLSNSSKALLHENSKLSAQRPLEKMALHRALCGDVSTIINLVAEWESDAALSIEEAVENIQFLSREEYLEVQRLGRLLLYAETETLSQLNFNTSPNEIIDDAGLPVETHKGTLSRFIPQTYLAATMLLSLVDAEQIVALPQGLRLQTALHPKEMLNKISLDADRYNSELIYLAHPELAFVAHYSLPSTVASFRQQGVKVFTLDKTETVNEVIETIERIGLVVGQPLKSRLLALFVKAAMFNLDNLRQRYLKEFKKMPEVLFLNYRNNFSIPTLKPITGQLLQRLGVMREFYNKESNNSSGEWSQNIDLEDIVARAPERLVVSSAYGEKMRENILNNRALQTVPAIQRGQLIFVDEDLQGSPTQFVVMAYYELLHALIL